MTTRYVILLLLNVSDADCFQRARYSPRHDRKSKTPAPEQTKKEKEEEERALRSGSEEGEIEED